MIKDEINKDENINKIMKRVIWGIVIFILFMILMGTFYC